MRITQVESQVLRLPLPKPVVAGRRLGDKALHLDHVFLLLVYLDTDAGHRGFGYSYALHGGGRAMKIIVEDDLSPLLLGEDPLDHERLGHKVYWRLQGIGRHGLVRQAYSAIDLALWDLKGKSAGLPLYKLLGGMRESTPAYGSDGGWLSMSVEEVIEAARAYMDQGLVGVKIKVGMPDPAEDAERLEKIRQALGENAWIGVDANQCYDYPTALAVGRVLEELGIDWFEEPLSCEDVDGHVRLTTTLEIPIALGETLFSRAEFRDYLERDAVDIVQPDLTRVGGLTEWLKIAALADSHHRQISPHLMPEVMVHLACGLPNVGAVELMPWFYPAFTETPTIKQGRMIPPSRPGLGLEPQPEVIAKYRLE